jgi:hypothetical protein
MESFATPFPIFFDDGEGSEPKAMGAIGVHSVLSFKRFQALMSQKINLPAGQLTAVFVCRRAVRHMPPVGWSWVRRSAAAHRPRRVPAQPAAGAPALPVAAAVASQPPGLCVSRR